MKLAIQKYNGAVRTVIFLLTHILLGILIQVGAAYILEGVISYFGTAQEEYSEVIESLTSTKPGMIVYVSIVAPLIEEAVFRLALIGLGKKILKFWIVNVISAILFGLYHGNIVQGIYAFLLGLVLGLLFEYSKGFTASSLVHISINIGGLYIAPMLNSMDTPVKNIMVGLVPVIAAGFVLLYIIKSDINRKVPVI